MGDWGRREKIMAQDFVTRLMYARQSRIAGRAAYYLLKLLGVEIPLSVEVGPGCVLGEDCEVGEGCELLARVEALAPQSVEHYRARLQERIQEVARGFTPDPARLAQEVALFADRLDVSEEITRLRSHLAQARAILGGGEPAGRKMEFLVQEMHREVNTIGSKTGQLEITHEVLRMKEEIEKLREQVQNLE